MKTLIACAVFVLVASPGLAADKPLAWSRFRGPNGSGIARGAKPPVEIGPTKNVKWKVPAPPGLSSPIVAGNLIVLTAHDKGKLYTIAYNRADGKVAWRRQAKAEKIEPFFPVGGSPASSTPATDGQRIVSYFGSCGLVCYDLQGKELWTYKLPMATIAGNFGSGVSPIIEDGLVILVRDELKQPTILAVDVASGKRRWEKKRQSRNAFCTPIVWNTPAGKQLAAAGSGRLVGYDLRTGAEKWSVAGMPSGCAPSPVTANGLLYFAGFSPGGSGDKSFQMPNYDGLLKMADANKDGVITRAEAGKTFLKDFFNNFDSNLDGKLERSEWDPVLKAMADGVNSAFAVKPGGTGDVSKSHVLWKSKRGLPYITSAILYRGQYVMLKDGGIVTSLDPQTGDQLSMKRIAKSGKYYASPVAANGYIYFASLDDGTVTVLKVTGKSLTIAATNPKLGEPVSATPAIAGDTLYVRTEKHLYAFAGKR